jgi:hypothetical protein
VSRSVGMWTSTIWPAAESNAVSSSLVVLKFRLPTKILAEMEHLRFVYHCCRCRSQATAVRIDAVCWSLSPALASSGHRRHPHRDRGGRIGVRGTERP